jgi:hypothetical protein
MFAWLASWFYTTDYSGPARNAPNEGLDIKKYIEEKPPEVKIITQEDIINAKNKLHKVEPNNKSSIYKSPLLKEFDNVFAVGYKIILKQEEKKNKMFATSYKYYIIT